VCKSRSHRIAIAVLDSELAKKKKIKGVASVLKPSERK
jgi:hypothetical protein